MKMEDGVKHRFRRGDRVIYVPLHVHQDFRHPDCEHGVVSSVNDSYVFVKFDGKFTRERIIDPDWNITAQACDPDDLITEDEAQFIEGV